MTFFYALIFTLLLSSTHAADRHLQCKVVGISDGDTLTCLVNKAQLKVRLVYIDAPEQAQPYGNKAKQALATLAFGKKVTLAVKGYDRYQRLLAVAYLENGENVNLALVQQGMAWAYQQTEPPYEHAQMQAQQARIGLWQDRYPINPADWRKQQSPPPLQAVKKDENMATSPKPIHCQVKLSCNKIANYELAKRYFQQCGWKELDGNNDGIPCNKLYRQSQKRN